MNLTDLINAIETAPAPFDTWQPKLCGDIDIAIDENGEWYFHNSKITRLPLVKLFAKVLTTEQGEFFLKTPVEKLRINVSDAPFVITEWYHKEGFIICRDNLERDYLLANHHTLVLKKNIPYLLLHHGLTAKISRNVFYQWANIATENNGHFTICSGGENFRIG